MDSMEQKLEQFKNQTRIPDFAVPKRYDLTLDLDLDACTFSGSVFIDVSILRPTNFLLLNALQLVILDASWTSGSEKKIPRDIISDDGDEMLVLGFDDSLRNGNGVLKIGFSGALNEQLRGLYYEFSQ